MAVPPKFQATFARLPLSFIPNRGQVNERVRFYGKSGTAGFFFAKDEVVYAFVQREGERPRAGVAGAAAAEEAQGHWRQTISCDKFFP